jgi:hypothetical protein
LPRETPSCFASPWRDGFWEAGVPRTVSGMKQRSNRIKCLGNGQVPLQAATAYKILEAGFQ